MTLWDGAPYEYTAAGGDLVFAAGACPLDEEGRVVASGDLVAQAERAVDNLVEALAMCGARPGDVVKATVYVVADERSDLVRVWDVVAPRLERAPSTLLGVSLLGYPGQLVEIDAVARLPGPA